MKKIIIILILVVLSVAGYFTVTNYYHSPSVYPFKSKFYTWAGDTRVIESDENCMSEEQLEFLRKHIKPGDILINRSNYYVSNIGIPGFWTHAGFYVGTEQERKCYLNSDKGSRNWVNSMGEYAGDINQLLKDQISEKYLLKMDSDSNYSVIESVSEGVVLSTFEHGAGKDGIAVLRPLLPKKEMTKAILKAYSYLDTNYDFNFDFSNDSTLACTELVYLVYGDSKLFPVNELFGKPFSTANEIAEYYDNIYGTDSLRLQCIFFYDGEKAYGPGNKTGHEQFRKSWTVTKF
ncbi:MAG: hypothetical protein JEZ03_11280 [Bacteroidales bacterium]|nr:hypothetical protein [Bacteroidales bacterium]